MRRRRRDRWRSGWGSRSRRFGSGRRDLFDVIPHDAFGFARRQFQRNVRTQHVVQNLTTDHASVFQDDRALDRARIRLGPLGKSDSRQGARTRQHNSQNRTSQQTPFLHDVPPHPSYQKPPPSNHAQAAVPPQSNPPPGRLQTEPPVESHGSVRVWNGHHPVATTSVSVVAVMARASQRSSVFGRRSDRAIRCPQKSAGQSENRITTLW